jgi:hypothetical protein
MAEDKKLDSKVVQAEPKKERTKRVPFGVPRSKLSVGKQIEGFHLRWINDEPGRIPKAMASGYVFVEPHEVDWESTGADPNLDENKIGIIAGTNKDGSTMYAYLMKTPMEFFEEDQQYVQGQLDAIDAGIRGGKLDLGANDNRYVPEGGITYKN